MITSIELQVISRILTSEDIHEVDTLCEFDESYYSLFSKQIHFILDHRQKYGNVPDVFTFQSEFDEIELVKVSESTKYLCQEMRKNKQHIILMETFNKIKDLGSGDVSEAWQYLNMQCDRVAQLSDTEPMDIVHQAKDRADQVIEYARQSRIPTGFPEIDKLMYGGLSTVEELVIILARTNTGKSWVCSKMMESAQRNGFPVLYYSPEMQSAFLGTRFDTWRAHFQNNQLFQGKYDASYFEYLKQLSKEETSAFILEDKDTSSGTVSVPLLTNLVKKNNIKLLIIDGLSYMEDTRRSDTDYTKYKNLCSDLFRLSKQYGCAVVIAMQANRATMEQRDDKGDPLPTMSNAEGSDHPARIATQVFAMRQVFDKHVLDIRLEKSRNANNQKPVLSYAWDVNTGNMQYLPSDDQSANIQPSATVSPIQSNFKSEDDIDLDTDDEDVEF